MIGVLFTVIQSLFGAFRPRGDLLLENLALRHQIAVLSRNAKKPRFSNSDRMLWIFLRTIWFRWKGALVILQPQTVVGWHRAGFRLFWRWKSRRPRIDYELIESIRRMWEEIREFSLRKMYRLAQMPPEKQREWFAGKRI